MNLLAQAANIPPVFEGATALPGWAFAAIGGFALLAVVATTVYRGRRSSAIAGPRATRAPSIRISSPPAGLRAD